MWRKWIPVTPWATLSAATLRPAWYGRRSILLGRERAFLNRCPHRGSRLLDEDAPPTAAPVLVCPYHGMGWRTDNGALTKAPRWDTCPALVLHRLAVAKYGPFTMVHARPDAKFPGQDPVPLERRLAEDLMVVRAQEEVHVRAPVPVVMENFLDTYHVPCLHRSTLLPSSRVERHREVGVDPWGWHFSTRLETPSPMVRGADPVAYYTGVWPAAFAFRLETHVFAVTLRPVGRPGEDEGTVETATLLAPPAWTAAEVQETLAFYRDVNNEDVVACERVARGRPDGLGGPPDVYHPELVRYAREFAERVEGAGG